MPFSPRCAIIHLVMAKKEDTPPRAYLLKGDEDFQKAQELDSLVNSLVSEDSADFDMERIEGDAATSDRIIAGLSIAPMASQRRLVVVRHAQKMAQEEQEKLAAKLDSIPRSGCLILVNSAVERVDGKPRRGSEVVGALSKAVRKVGQVREFGGERKQEKASNARTFAKEQFGKFGKRIDAQAMTFLIQRAGTDFSVLKTEIEKLVAYSGDAATVTAADVQAITSETPEEKVFKLIDAVAARDQAMAVSVLAELFETSDRPEADAPRVLANVARQFRLLWQVKFLQSAGYRSMQKGQVPEEVRRQLPSQPNLLDIISRQGWQQDRLSRQAAGFSQRDLARCFISISRADRRLKGIEDGIEDPVVAMELLVIDLASSGRRLLESRGR